MIVSIEASTVHIIAFFISSPHAHRFTAYKRYGIKTCIIHVATQQLWLYQKTLTDRIHLQFELKLTVLADKGQLFMTSTIYHDRVSKVNQVELDLQSITIVCSTSAQ